MNAKQKLAFEIALSQYGIKERQGGENYEILKYFREIGFPEIKEEEELTKDEEEELMGGGKDTGGNTKNALGETQNPNPVSGVRRVSQILK